MSSRNPRKPETPLQREIRISKTRKVVKTADPREGNAGRRDINYILPFGNYEDLGMTPQGYVEYIQDINRNQAGNGKKTNSKIKKILKKILKGKGPKKNYVKQLSKEIKEEQRKMKEMEEMRRRRPNQKQEFKEFQKPRNLFGEMVEEDLEDDLEEVPIPTPISRREGAVRDLSKHNDDDDNVPTVGSGMKRIPIYQPQRGGGQGRSFAHDFAHGIFKVLPVITGLATIINKLGISSKPEEWVAKATDYLKNNETQRQFIQEDINSAENNAYTWKELYAFKKAGYSLPERFSDQLAKEMDEETRKYEYLQANPIQISQAEQQTTQYKKDSQLFINKYAKELNKFLALPSSDFNAQKNNIRLREINIRRSNYLYKSPVLDDLLAKINTRLTQVGAGNKPSRPFGDKRREEESNREQLNISDIDEVKEIIELLNRVSAQVTNFANGWIENILNSRFRYNANDWTMESDRVNYLIKLIYNNRDYHKAIKKMQKLDYYARNHFDQLSEIFTNKVNDRHANMENAQREVQNVGTTYRMQTNNTFKNFIKRLIEYLVYYMYVEYTIKHNNSYHPPPPPPSSSPAPPPSSSPAPPPQYSAVGSGNLFSKPSPKYSVVDSHSYRSIINILGLIVEHMFDKIRNEGLRFDIYAFTNSNQLYADTEYAHNLDEDLMRLIGEAVDDTNEKIVVPMGEEARSEIVEKIHEEINQLKNHINMEGLNMMNTMSNGVYNIRNKIRNATSETEKQTAREELNRAENKANTILRLLMSLAFKRYVFTIYGRMLNGNMRNPNDDDRNPPPPEFTPVN